jgi:hypothetical protein
VLNQRECIGHQLLYGFFTLYSRLYKAISLPAHIADELRADRNALDLINSDELLSALQARFIAHAYFENYFWPDMKRSGAAVRPFQRLYQTAQSDLSQSQSEAWLQRHSLVTDNTDQQFPTLQQRMKNLGLTSVKLPPDLTQCAAEYYLQNHLARIINMWDRNWLQVQHNVHAEQTTARRLKQSLKQTVKPVARQPSSPTARQKQY